MHYIAPSFSSCQPSQRSYSLYSTLSHAFDLGFPSATATETTHTTDCARGAYTVQQLFVLVVLCSPGTVDGIVQLGFVHPALEDWHEQSVCSPKAVGKGTK